MLFINKLFNSIACLLSFTNLQLVIPGRTWILLYLGRTVYKRLWACLALYLLTITGNLTGYCFIQEIYTSGILWFSLSQNMKGVYFLNKTIFSQIASHNS